MTLRDLPVGPAPRRGRGGQTRSAEELLSATFEGRLGPKANEGQKALRVTDMSLTVLME